MYTHTHPRTHTSTAQLPNFTHCAPVQLIHIHQCTHTRMHSMHICIFHASSFLLSLYSYNCIANIALSLSRCLPVCHPEWFRLLFACLQFPIDVNGRRCGRAGERESAECVPYVKCTINSRRARCPAQCMATLPRR